VLSVPIEADSRRFLEQRSPLFRAVGEQQVDHLGFNHHSGIAAEAGASQEVLDVPQPYRGTVEQVVALAGTGEPPGYHDLPIGDGQVAITVVEKQRDLRHVDGPPCGGALKDDVFHLAASQQPSRLLAQDPAHRIGNVRFAAPVRSDDGGDTFLKSQGDGVGERFESGEFQLGELHAAVPETRVNPMASTDPGPSR
jgi:hypothetical protein